MRKLLWPVCAAAIAYQLLQIAASVRFRTRKRKVSDRRPPVSILKPVHTVDADTYAAFVSQASQDYAQFEILFGVRDAHGEAAADIRRLQQQFPSVDIRLIVSRADAPNQKVGQLIDLARHARYPIWVVSDADIKVGPGYLASIAAPFEDGRVGAVTCPYAATGHSAAARWEAFGIGIDFVPSAMVANLIGVRDFALGATLAFRAADWAATGGFEAIRDYIADDYQVGHRLARLGKHSLLSEVIVETSQGDGSWRDVWRHQLRWARTIRLSKPTAFAALPITHAGLWTAVAAVSGLWRMAASLFVVRCAAGAMARWSQRLPVATPAICLTPAWDVYAFAVWTASYLGRDVRWGDRVLKLGRDGKIVG